MRGDGLPRGRVGDVHLIRPGVAELRMMALGGQRDVERLRPGRSRGRRGRSRGGRRRGAAAARRRDERYRDQREQTPHDHDATPVRGGERRPLARERVRERAAELGVPAAATRERALRSSGAASIGASSKSSIAKPRSRTISCAAAKSTARDGLRQTTASVATGGEVAVRQRLRAHRAHAVGQRRQLGAGSRRRAARASPRARGTRCSPSAAPVIGSPFRNAPSPRAAIHSSFAPKS